MTRRGSWSRRCCRSRTPSWRRSWRAGPAATRCSWRRWSGASRRRAARTSPSCPRPSRPCSPPGSTRSRRSSGASSSTRPSCGQSFWQDALSNVAMAEGCDLEETLATLEEKDILVPEAGARRAGDPELAFKHVLIRDVAYGMLPKAVRARKHLEVGAFLEERAGDRAEEVVTLLAEHYARAATLGRESSLPTGELRAHRHEGAALPGGGGRRGERRLLQPGGVRALPVGPRPRRLAGGRDPCAHRGEAGRLRAAPRPGRRGARAVARLPRVPPRRGGPRARGCAVPQDRRRARPQGRAPGRHRAPPARDQPAQGRAAQPRARPPLRGGRPPLHQHGRQHARHLRGREGPAPGRATGRDARGEPRPRDLRVASSGGSATRPRRARTWSARSSSRAAPTRRRRSAR